MTTDAPTGVLAYSTGDLGYWAALRRVRAARGPASGFRCRCGRAAVMWRYGGGDPKERIDPARNRRFSLDPERYEPRCRPCAAGRRAALGKSYKAVLRRVRAQRGPAGAQTCACGRTAAGWSYAGGDPDERLDVERGRPYSLDPARYVPRCGSCRMAGAELDAARVCRLYAAGATTRGIAAVLHTSRSRVLRTLRAEGVDIRPPGPPRRPSR
jgi:hypothetical protein